jgi:hypothetical protein
MPQPPPTRYAAPEPTVHDAAPAGWQQRPQPQDEATRQWTPQQGANQGQWPAQPPAQPPAQGQGRRAGRGPRRRRVRRSVMALFAVVVLLIVLVIADRVACAVAENEMASQFKSQGFPVKPSVNIEGFPFLTQLAAKDFKKVDISASNVPAGPVTISTVHATIDGLHVSSFSSNAKATVDRLNATAFISFGALAAAGGLGGGTGITVTQAGTDTLKITAGLGGVFSDTEEAKITQTGAQTIQVKVLANGGAVGDLLSSFGTFSFSLPKGVPASTRITGLSLNSQGLTVSAAATDATFSQ